MAKPDRKPVTMEELVVFSFAQTDGLFTREEFMQEISEERATYQRLLNPTAQ